MHLHQASFSESGGMTSQLDHRAAESRQVVAGTCQKSASFGDRSIKTITLNRPKENFGLSAKDFENLCQHLQKGDTILFEKIFLAHFSDCTQYLLAKYKVQYDDAYDATMDTLLTFRQRLVDGKIQYGNMRFLYTQMASQHLLRKLKSSKYKTIENLQIADTLPDLLSKEDLSTLSIAWNRLSSDCQELLRLNYYQGLKLVHIAKQLNKNANAVRKQKERCQGKLIEYFKKQTISSK